ncbi:MAG: hypothetical protein LBR32_07600, partial [Propionibacteriaceae bacterium]|nr:hypothetical protein [Propionibacteriaceae bacterium]
MSTKVPMLSWSTKHERGLRRLRKPLAWLGAFATAVGVFAGTTAPAQAQIPDSSQRVSEARFDPKFSNEYASTGIDWGKKGDGLEDYETSRLWITGYSGDETTGTSDGKITLSDGSTTVVGTWGGWFSSAVAGGNIVNSRPTAAWGWFNAADSSDRESTNTGRVWNKSDITHDPTTVSANSAAGDQVGSIGIDGGGYNDPVKYPEYVGNGAAAYFEPFNDYGQYAPNPGTAPINGNSTLGSVDRNGNVEPSDAKDQIPAAFGVDAGSVCVNNIPKAGGGYDTAPGYWFFVTEIPAGTSYNSTGYAKGFWVPSSNLGAMKGSFNAFGYRCVGAAPDASYRQQGWAGLEVYQRTGELYFMNDRGANLVSPNPAAWTSETTWNHTCLGDDDTSSGIRC